MSTLRGETHPSGTVGADLKGVLHCPLVCLFTIHATLFDEVDEGMGQCGEAVVLDHEVFLSSTLIVWHDMGAESSAEGGGVYQRSLWS